MAYTRGPHAAHSSLPLLPRPILHSSRSIEATTGRYVVDSTTGGFESMPSTAQRVLLIVSHADVKTDFITDQDAEEARRRIMNALDVLTSGQTPAIKLLRVEVGSDSTGTTYRRVDYRNLLTGLDESVQA